MFNLTIQERKVLIALSVFAILGLAVLGYRNYVARTQFEIVPSSLETAEVDYEVLLKQKRMININTADVKELEALPNIGPKLAKEIVDYRAAHGRFFFKKDLMKVNGIGPKKFERMKEYILLE